MARVHDGRNSRLVLGWLVLAHLVAISHQVDGGGGVSLLERALFAVLSPLQRGVGVLVSGLGGAWAGYVDLRGVRQQNQRLESRLHELETALQAQKAGAEEAARLRHALELRERLPLATIAAEVVARDGQPWYRTVTLDKGSADGLGLNAPVISSTGIVGRVVRVGRTAARVQLLLDRDSGVGVLVERSRVSGVVSGQVGSQEGGPGAGSGELVMKYVPAGADVVENDLLVSSGADRIFPKGLVVGRVRSVSLGSGLFKEIRVTPGARFDRLEEVLVIAGPAAQPLDTPETVR